MRESNWMGDLVDGGRKDDDDNDDRQRGRGMRRDGVYCLLLASVLNH